MNIRKVTSKKLYLPFLVALMFSVSSCKDDLLELVPPSELATTEFWQTEDDALYALHGAYAAVRPVFDRDYYFDGHGEYVRVRGNSSSTSGTLRLGAAYTYGNFKPMGYGSSFNDMYKFLYGAVNRTNYVIENVERMLPSAHPTSVPNLERIIGEAKLLRGMVYFKLISMWGDVPYFANIIKDNSEVANIERTPIAQIKDYIMEDFTYAYEKLPIEASENGRASKPAALAFRGKLQLYWASWNNFGWPELNTFAPSEAEAEAAYLGAAADFKSVIEDFDLDLFRGGDPGGIDELGKAEILPNYYYLFTSEGNESSEVIMSFTHAGMGLGQGEEILRDFAGRSVGNSQAWVTPRYELADRYQSTVTGDFLPPLEPMDPTLIADARTAPNSAVNPQSYADRDYRMKATIMWDYEMTIGIDNSGMNETGWVPFIFRNWGTRVTIDGQEYTTYNTDGTNSGYVFRKFVRNYAGMERSQGDYSFPVMRLADVFLMYAEATNEVNGPQPDAIEYVNRVRHRGNLPPLAADKTASKEDFFDAIEQERIVELVGEGHRSFDLRRWRALERVWGAPGSDGRRFYNTWGNQVEHNFQNSSLRAYQQNYIFMIPQGERDRNPNLTQNPPWL